MTHPYRRNKNDKIVKKNNYQAPVKGSKFIPSEPGIIDKILSYDPSIAEKKDYDELSELKRDFVKTGRGKEFRGVTFVDRKTGRTMLDTPYDRNIVGPERIYKAPDVRYFPKDQPVEKKKSGGRVGFKQGAAVTQQQKQQSSNKFLKERSGAAVTQPESNRIENALSKEKSGAAVTQQEINRIKNKFLKERSGAVITEKESNRIKNELLKKRSGAAVTPQERQRYEDAMPQMSHGGEVEIGKGKDYIKDLL